MARTPPALPTVDLTGSGYRVEFRPIGPLTVEEIRTAVRKALPEPDPPMNTVQGLDGKDTQEPNTADPDYLRALAEHDITVNTEVGERLFRLIARRSIATPVDAEAVAQLRSDMADIGVELPKDDRDVFVRHILIGSNQDMTDLQNAILRRSQPTREAVTEKVESFSDPVQES